MTRKVLIDNNIWAADEKGYHEVVDYIEYLLKDDVDAEIYMTRIIEMELLSFSEIETNPQIKEGREGYIQLVDHMLEVDKNTTHLAAQIRRKAKLAGRSAPKGPDALIAASASLHNLTIVSNNDKDFLWASKQSDFKFEYINPIKDNEAYREYCRLYEEAKKTAHNDK